MKKICVIGNFSGRNAGDAAILGCLLQDVSSLYSDALFEVPTINPGFVVQHYVTHKVRPVSLLPWKLSLKILGVPIFRSVLSADLVLVTDAILFDLKLFNPLFNYLSTMAVVLPMAKRRGIPVVLYNVSLGPLSTTFGTKCLERVMHSSALVVVRDTESIDILQRAGIDSSHVCGGADCALNVSPTSGNKLNALIVRNDLPIDDGVAITFNVNSYIDVFVRQGKNGMSADDLVALLGDAINRIMTKLDVHVVFTVTQPMDLKITRRVMQRVALKERVRMVSNIDHTYQDLAGFFSKAAIHIGMRTHSLILASAVNTPIVGIVATPKNRGFMKSIGQERRMIEFPELTPERLTQVAVKTFENRDNIRVAMKPIIEREKAKARDTARLLARFLS
jgi:polysaccharide pyruvyl transferase WcaK-like protein